MHRRIRIFCVLLSVAGFWAAESVQESSAAVPETPRPRQLTVADGLPSNRINGITEDHNGYLWIATSDGLARYDGIGFRVWRSEDGLGDNTIWAVHVDRRNRIWIGTDQAGLAVLDVDRKHFRHYNRANTPAMGSDTIWSVASTPEGALWFGTSPGGLHRLTDDGEVTRFMPRPDDPRSLPHSEVGQLAVAPDGALWIGTRGGVARWTGSDFERLPATALASPLINGISVESDGTLWFGTPQGVAVRRPDGSYSATPWADLGLKDTIYHVLLRDRSGLYWFDIQQGLGHERDGALSVVPLYSETAQGMVRPSWMNAYQDREGGLWFPSYTSGLWYLPADWHQFTALARRVGDPATLANAHVRGIASSAKGAWLVGSGGVLDEFDTRTGAIRHVAEDIGEGFVLTNVLEDSRGVIWVSYVNGLAQVFPATGRVKRWTTQSSDDASPPGEIMLAEVGDGTVWVAEYNGMMQARDHDGRVIESLLAGDGRGLPTGVAIEQIGRAPDGTLWVAGSQGLSMWNAGARRFENVPGAPAAQTSGFTIGGDGRVWLARLGALEAYRWDGAGLHAELSVDASQGMPLIAPKGLTVDAEGIVWATSMRGLIRCDPTDRSVRVYGVRDGLPSQEFGSAPVLHAADGHILAGSPEGLLVFDPAQVRPNTLPPRLIIESVDVRRKDDRISLLPDRAFELRHGDRDLRVVARLLSFNDASNHVYRFFLSGYDTGWVEVGAGGERIFSQLEPGDYRLQVSARTADNVWSDVRLVSFTVVPPWWRTSWAYAGCVVAVLLVLGLSATLYRRRVRRRTAYRLAQQQRRLAEQASDAKTRFLATMSHEIRTPMTGVLGMSELLLDGEMAPRQREQVEAIRHAGQHLLRLVNDALDLARIEAGKLALDDTPFDLRALLDEACALLAPLAERKGLAFRCEIAADAPNGLRGDAQRLRQILLNLGNNAIKFTARGEVRLKARALAPQGVVLEVFDTGPGLSAEQQARLFRRFEQAEGAKTAARYGGSGLGLAISQELAAAMGGCIAVASTLGRGALFTVELPLAAASIAEVRAAVVDTASPPDAGAYRVLLVEDDATVAQVICGLLRVRGHAVRHVSHGLAALTALGADEFDLVLLDLDLPAVDGFELARLIRARGHDLPLVIVTARADAEAELQARTAGMAGFLRKPVTGDMLARAIAAAVSVPVDEP